MEAPDVVLAALVLTTSGAVASLWIVGEWGLERRRSMALMRAAEERLHAQELRQATNHVYVEMYEQNVRSDLRSLDRLKRQRRRALLRWRVDDEVDNRMKSLKFWREELVKAKQQAGLAPPAMRAEQI